MAFIYRLDSLSATEGRYSFMTESNSFYEVIVSKDKRTLTRYPEMNNNEAKLRKDNHELIILGEFSIEVGKPAIFRLEPLGIFGDCTIRRTNIVKRISYIH
ncbi:hypothetical protein J14TS2_20980 [Bacillus sp. J14TS2]|uniref:hypothetical protein n=1 Tax=Bacillus sp. J14TS2 TaxID=2807188 RepID=UPI001B2B1CAA|nr:hypothetical protein [Bacillus sp. J14TS2]GIN71623.1 hypothetical protein J14TS2_20980 [Bacillus sp. J14TS2]